jgi:hypothetical protein
MKAHPAIAQAKPQLDRPRQQGDAPPPICSNSQFRDCQ